MSEQLVEIDIDEVSSMTKRLYRNVNINSNYWDEQKVGRRFS